MNNAKQFHDILFSIWKFAPGLGKTVFHWRELPKQVKVLAGTDNSGIVKYGGKRYYIRYEWGIGISIKPD